MKIALCRGNSVWKKTEIWGPEPPPQTIPHRYMRNLPKEELIEEFVEVFERNAAWGPCPCCTVVVYNSRNWMELPEWARSPLPEDATREERLDARERELIEELKRLKQEYMSRCAPVGRELNELRESRDSSRTRDLLNGLTVYYTGPLPKYLLPEERWGR